ncbi:MAG: hypothetical protein ACREAZ_06355 [Nitrososphaera sp.]
MAKSSRCVVDMDNSIYACLPDGMSSAAELAEAGKEDRAEGQGEAKQDLHDEQGPELAVVVPYFLLLAASVARMECNGIRGIEMVSVPRVPLRYRRATTDSRGICYNKSVT